MKKPILFLAVALAGFALKSQAADDTTTPPPPPPPEHEGGPGHRPPPPLDAVLDANGDGVINASEIANASESLKKLDANGDGVLSPDEYRPPHPPRHGGPGCGPSDGSGS